MLTKKQINERIDFAFKDLKIPENAERIFLTDEIFQSLKQSGTSPEMGEYFHCCENETYNDEDFWKHNCWIEDYCEGNWDLTQDDVWISIKSVFKIFLKESRKNSIAYRYCDKRNNRIKIYIIGRHFDYLCRDYIILIELKKVSLKKNFPPSYYMTRFRKNTIPLREILKYNDKKISA